MFGLIETLQTVTPVVASLVSNTVQGAGYQIAFQAAVQAESISAGEMNKHVLDNVFGCIHVACQHDGQLEQTAMILVINLPQGFATSPLEFPDKQLIFHYFITHRIGCFYIWFFEKFFRESCV